MKRGVGPELGKWVLGRKGEVSKEMGGCNLGGKFGNWHFIGDIKTESKKHLQLASPQTKTEKTSRPITLNLCADVQPCVDW